MKENSFTQSMAWLHTWAGLVIGWLLFAIVFAGTLSVYAPEITRWMQPETHRAGAAPSREAAIAVAEHWLRAHAAQADTWHIGLPSARAPLVEAGWRQGRGPETEVHLDPASGEVVLARETEGGEHFVRLHANLRGGTLGVWVVTVATVAMLAAIISGIIIHKKIFKDFFTFRPGKGQRSWLDAHNASGVLTLPFLLMIAYTGATIAFMQVVPSGLLARYGTNFGAARADVVRNLAQPPKHEAAPLLPLAPFLARAETVLGAQHVDGLVIRHPGDAGAQVEAQRDFSDRLAAVADRAVFSGVDGRRLDQQTDWNGSAYAYRSLVGMHIAQFGGAWVYALYFVSGLAGSALVATGLVLFTVKRKKADGRVTEISPRFHRAAESLNVAAVAGLMLACAAYLWANRLLPAELPARGAREIQAFFIVWLLTVPHAFLRPARQAWREQLLILALLCLLLPVLNALTGGLPLPQALVAGNAQVAGVDLAAFGLGALMLAAALRIGRARPARAGRRNAPAQALQPSGSP
ncbi:MAG: PepSY-associated TM helix domain-containing protein [Solimonas sp.]